MTKLLASVILFSKAVRSVVAVAKLVILGISPLTSFTLSLRKASVATLVTIGISPLTSFSLALREALVAKLVIPGALSLIFLILALYIYISFLTTSFFTRSLSLLKSTGTNYQHLI